jgi:hypothetical protein
VPVDVPVHEAAGGATGRTVRVPSPPPEVWVEAGERFELRRFEELERFGCGCIRHERVVYVPTGEQTAPEAWSAGATRRRRRR